MAEEAEGMPAGTPPEPKDNRSKDNGSKDGGAATPERGPNGAGAGGAKAEAEAKGPPEPAAPEADRATATPPEPPAEGLLEQARREAAEHFDKYVRLQAEFDNYKRRMHKEQSEVMKFAQLPLLRDLAGVVDNLERAIAHARNSNSPDHQPFVEGLELVTRQMSDVFERYGMTRIAAKGEPFDPRKHEAMKVVETDEVPENTVIEEFRTGYAMRERIVRPAMVSVSKKPQATAGEQPSGAGAAE